MILKYLLIFVGLIGAEKNYFDCNEKNPKTGRFYIKENHPCCRYGDTTSICYNLDSIYQERGSSVTDLIANKYVGKVFYAAENISDVASNIEAGQQLVFLEGRIQSNANGSGEQKWPSTIFYTAKMASKSDTLELECSFKQYFDCPYLLDQEKHDSVKAIKNTIAIDAKRKKERKAAENKATELARKENLKKYMINQNWPSQIQSAIEQNKVIIGMTKEQVKLSWGKPADINRTITRSIVREQWVYGSSYLYFENDLLETIQD